MGAAASGRCEGEGRPARALRWLALALALAAPGALAQNGAATLTLEESTELERLLNRLSFYPGPIDGVIDQDAERAIEAYQAFAILPVDGLATRTLLNELRAVAGHLEDLKPAEQVAAEKKAAEEAKAAAEKAAAEKAEAARLAAEKKAAEEKAAAEKAAAEQAAAEKAEAERTPAEQKAAEEKAAAEKAAAEKAAAEKAAAEKAAAERAAQQQASLAKPATANAGGWRLQLSSLQPLEEAQANWATLQAAQTALADLSFLPEPLTLNGRQFARVLAGPLGETEAKQRCVALEIEGVSCLAVAAKVIATAPQKPAKAEAAAAAAEEPAPAGPAVPPPPTKPVPPPVAVAALTKPDEKSEPVDLAAPCLPPRGAAPLHAPPSGNDFRAGFEAAGRGAFDLAIAYYGKALRTAGLPDDVRAVIHFDCANALHYRGDFVGAIANFGRALELNPRLADALYNRGFAYQALGKTVEANADFRAAYDMGLRRLGVRAPDFAPAK